MSKVVHFNYFFEPMVFFSICLFFAFPIPDYSNKSFSNATNMNILKYSNLFCQFIYILAYKMYLGLKKNFLSMIVTIQTSATQSHTLTPGVHASKSVFIYLYLLSLQQLFTIKILTKPSSLFSRSTRSTI